MPAPVLSSTARRLLVDAALADGIPLAELVASLREARPDCELIVLGGSQGLAGDLPQIPGGEEETAALDAAMAQRRLEGALVLSARERILGWARHAGLAALAPGPDQTLADHVTPHALVLNDAVAMLLRARRRREGRPYLVGVNGIDKAGKTVFTNRLAARLEDLGFRTECLAMTEFVAEKKERRAKGYPEAEGLYHKHYALERLRKQLLWPLQQCRELPLQLHFDVYDADRERLAEKRSLHLDRDSMAILEGPYLFQGDLFSFFDFRIYLVSDFERAIDLALGDLTGKAREKRLLEFQRRELAAQSLYLKQEAPWKRAHLVLRGVNSETPSVEQVQLEVARGEFPAGAGD